MNDRPDNENKGLMRAASTLSRAKVEAMGYALRERTPARKQAYWKPTAHRPNPVELISTSNEGRLPYLVPLRVGRMISSPYAFLRGAAGLMAVDLAHTPDSGLNAQICGDAHVGNFGFYGSPERAIVMDINDFDETIVAPWEYDLKRLATSLVVTGRHNGVNESSCREAALHCSRYYRKMVKSFAAMPTLEFWYFKIGASTLDNRQASVGLRQKLLKLEKKAIRNIHSYSPERWTQNLQHTGWKFLQDPPLLTYVPHQIEDEVINALQPYIESLSPERQSLIHRFAVCDVAFRIVGVGSVGKRNYMVLLQGNQDEQLVLQVKEANPSVFEPFVTAKPALHNGQRIVMGQKLVQTVSDILLGWTTIDKRHFYVRQYRNRKGAIDPEKLNAEDLIEYGKILGAMLAKAHCRSIEPAMLNGYCRQYIELDEAFADFAQAYADQTERDYDALVKAVKAGKLPAETGL